MAITDGVTPLNAANLPHRTGSDTVTGAWAFTTPIGTAGGFNYLRNGDLEIWLAGTAVAPTGWILTGAGATVARDATNRKLGTYAAAVTRVGTDCYLGQNLVTLVGPVGWWQNKTVTVGCWVRATVASRARLAINDGVGTTNGAYHTGGSAFEFLTVTRTLNGAATQVEVRLVVDTGNTTAQFDGAILVLGSGIQDFVPGGLDATSGDEPETIAASWQFSRPIGTAGGVSWVFNGDQEIWGSGVAAAPTGWTLAGAGASVARNTANVKISATAAAVTRAGTNCYLVQNVPAIGAFGPVARWQGQVVTFGCWVRATVGSAARLTINDGVGSSTSSNHSGGSAYEWLQVSRTIDASATVVELRCEVIVDTTCQFDGATCVLGASVQDYIPSAWRRQVSTAQFGTAATIAITATPNFLGPGLNSATEIQVSWREPSKCVLRRLTADASANVTTNAVLVTLRKDETTDTLLTTTVAIGTRTNSDLVNEVEVAAGGLVSIKLATAAGSSGSVFWKAALERELIP